MTTFFEDIFNKQQCGFLKGDDTQQCLLKCRKNGNDQRI